MDLNVTAQRATKEDGSDGTVTFTFRGTPYGDFDLVLPVEQALHAAQDIMSAGLTARRPQLTIDPGAMKARPGKP